MNVQNLTRRDRLIGVVLLIIVMIVIVVAVGRPIVQGVQNLQITPTPEPWKMEGF